MCNDETLFSDMVSLKQPQTVTAGDGRQLKATGRETVVLDIEVSGRDRKCTLSDALCVPDLKFSLLSVAEASKAVKCNVFTDNGCEFINGKGEVVAADRKMGKMYFLDCKGLHSSKGDHWHWINPGAIVAQTLWSSGNQDPDGSW